MRVLPAVALTRLYGVRSSCHAAESRQPPICAYLILWPGAKCLALCFARLTFFCCILLLSGALVAIGDCNRAGRPRPWSEPSVLSAPAPLVCAIANPQLPRSSAAANVNLVAFNIA